MQLLDKPEASWNQVLWLNETKIELFGYYRHWLRRSLLHTPGLFYFPPNIQTPLLEKLAHFQNCNKNNNKVSNFVGKPMLSSSCQSSDEHKSESQAHSE